MTVEEEIEALPIQLIEALLRHDFFTAAMVKERKKAIEAWIHMNGGEIHR